jgi:hypothetical protein
MALQNVARNALPFARLLNHLTQIPDILRLIVKGEPTGRVAPGVF